MQVEKELAGRGFEKTAAEPPDVLVLYHASVMQKIDTRNLDTEYDSCDGGDCEPTSTTPARCSSTSSTGEPIGSCGEARRQATSKERLTNRSFIPVPRC